MSDPRRPEPASPTARGVIRRHAALLVATTALVTAGGYGYAALQAPTYTAHAKVLVEAVTPPAAAPRTPDMGTEVAVATSDTVLRPAAAALHLPLSTVAKATSVGVVPNAQVLDIGYSAGVRTAARDGAAAVARAYIDYRRRTEAPTAAGLAASLLTPAARPHSPSAPNVLVHVLAGLVVGLVVAGAAALVTDRYGRRIRSAAQWEDATGVPVLLTLSGRERPPDAADPVDDDAHALRYLRIPVARALPATGGVLLVTSVGEEAHGRALARGLATALLDAGGPVALLEMRQAAEGPGASGLQLRLSRGAPGRPMPTDSAWQAATVSDLLAALTRHRAEQVVVVSAPPPSVSVCALDAAALADGCLLVDALPTARRSAATRAVTAIRDAGGVICGSVLLTSRRSATAPATAGATEVRPADRRRPTPRRPVRPEIDGRVTVSVAAIPATPTATSVAFIGPHPSTNGSSS